MKNKIETYSVIKYSKFLNNTLLAKEFRTIFGDQYTRMIFDYFEDEPLFDPQVFCAFMWNFLIMCRGFQSLVMRDENNLSEDLINTKLRIRDDILLCLNKLAHKFSLLSIEPKTFGNTLLHEKLKHLLENEEFSGSELTADMSDFDYNSMQAAISRNNIKSWKIARLRITTPEIWKNSDNPLTYDLEFTLLPFSLEQKLDIFHFTICALNYLSIKDLPRKEIKDMNDSSIIYEMKPSQLKVISDALGLSRDEEILRTIEQREQDNREIEQTLAERILQAQTQDPKVEKKWLDESPQIFVSPQEERIPTKKQKQSGYPPFMLEQIIDTAVRLCESLDKPKAIDIYNEVNIDKKTYNARIKFFDYTTPMIFEEARRRIREGEKRGKT